MPSDTERGGDDRPDVPVPDSPDARAYGRYAGMGLTFAVTVIVFGALGWWVDGMLSTTPLFLIAGTLAGFAGGLISMVKRVPPVRGRQTSHSARPEHSTRPDPRQSPKP